MLLLALFRYANPGREDDHRTGFIANTSVGLLKLLEPLDQPA
jgi:hypothetical protein